MEENLKNVRLSKDIEECEAWKGKGKNKRLKRKRGLKEKECDALKDKASNLTAER